MSTQLDIKQQNINNKEKNSTLVSTMSNYAKSDASIVKNGITKSSTIVNNSAGAAATKAANDISTLSKKVISGETINNVQSSASSIVNTASNWASKGLNAATAAGNSASSLFGSITGTASKFANTAADVASGAANSVSGLLDKAGNYIGNYINDGLASLTNVTNKINSVTSEALGWFNDTVNSITSSDKNSTSTVKTAFVTSDNKQGIENANLPASELGINLSGITGSGIDKFKELSGSANNLFDAVKNVKNTVVSGIQNVSNVGKSVLSTISNTVNTALSPVKSVINTANKIVDPNNIKSLVGETLDFLPFGLDKTISNIAYNETARIANKISRVESKLGGILSIGDKLANLVGYSQNSNQLLSDAGKIIFGLATGNISKTELDNLYNAAMTVCPNVAGPSYVDFGDNKLLYDALMQESIEMGCANLISQLTNCGSYFDTNTKKLMEDNLVSAASTGDSLVVNAILEATGTNAIADPKEYALGLGTNLKQDNISGVTIKTIEKDEQGNATTVYSDNVNSNEVYLSSYVDVLGRLNITPIELVSEEIDKITGTSKTKSKRSEDQNTELAYSVTNMAIMARNPTVLEGLGISEDVRNMVLTVGAKYASVL